MTKKKDILGNIDEFIASVEKETIQKVAKTAQGKLVAHVAGLIEEVKTIIKNNDNGFAEVIEYLDKQEKSKIDLIKETNDAYNSIAKSLKALAKQTQDVKVTNHPKQLTKKEMQSAFSDALDVVENILVSQNQVPSAVSVEYNNQGKVSQITENYDGYRLTTTIRYTGDRVSSWSTKRG